MTGNAEDVAIGASTRTRKGEDDNLQWHYNGDIGNILMFDRPLEDIEAVFLAEGEGELESLFPLYEGYAAPETEEEEEEASVEEEDSIEDEETVEEEEPDQQGETGETEEEPAEAEDDEQPAPEEPEEASDENEEQPASAEEEEAGDEGVFASITQLFMMIFTLFGLLGGGADNDEVDEALDDAENLLSELVPSTGEMDETMPDGMEEDEEEMMEAA